MFKVSSSIVISLSYITFKKKKKTPRLIFVVFWRHVVSKSFLPNETGNKIDNSESYMVQLKLDCIVNQYLEILQLYPENDRNQRLVIIIMMG